MLAISLSECIRALKSLGAAVSLRSRSEPTQPTKNVPADGHSSSLASLSAPSAAACWVAKIGQDHGGTQGGSRSDSSDVDSSAVDAVESTRRYVASGPQPPSSTNAISAFGRIPENVATDNVTVDSAQPSPAHGRQSSGASDKTAVEVMLDSLAHVTRKFHDDDAAYVLPTDDGELARLNLQHRLMIAHLGGVVLAPITLQPGDEVLDSGSGTGSWLLAAAAAYPTALFTGADVSDALFPATPPAHVRFTVASALALPPAWHGRFALAHQRMLMGALTRTQWPVAVGQLRAALRPGGWIQLAEGSRHVGGPACARLMDMLGQLADARGLHIDVHRDLKLLLERAGFEHVVEVRRVAPLGAWAGELGALGRSNVVSGYRAMKAPFVKSGLVASGEEFDALLDEMSEELDSTVGAHMQWVACHGQKPLDDDESLEGM